MKYIDSKDDFKEHIVPKLNEKLSQIKEHIHDSVLEDIFMDSINEEYVDDFIELLKSEDIEYTIEDDRIIIERTSKIVRKAVSGSGVRSKKLTKSLQQCRKGETRVGNRGCRPGTTAKSKMKARKIKITKKKNPNRTQSGDSKRLNKAIGKNKASASRKANRKKSKRRTK